MWPAVKLGFEQEKFRQYVTGLRWSGWRPSRIVWHNTAAPSLAQWIASAKADKANGLVPGITRIKNLEAFFRDNNHWSGCPHLFIASDLIWVMNPLTAPGVHSPSWNSTSIGIEMIGDFSTENDDAGDGLKVKNNTIFATAVLCEAIGLDAVGGEVLDVSHRTTGTIFLHKQDWATTHDCPGVHIARDKGAMIAAVAALMSGGEHNGEITKDWHGKTTVPALNLRKGPGAMNASMGLLPLGVTLIVNGEAKNGTTTWLRVKTPAGYIGWVSGAFVERTNQ